MQNPLKLEEIYHRVLGEASAKHPIVFLHGLLGYSSNWGKIWPYFQSERQVLVLDQRGHGRSAKPQTNYAPEDYALDLKNLLEHLSWTKIHLVGHSMGGRVAMLFAHKYPNYLNTLTLEDSGALGRPDRSLWFEDLFASTPTPFSTKEKAKEFLFQKFSDNLLLANFLYSNIERNKESQYDWRFPAPKMVETIELGRAKDASEIFQAISTPSLLIRGGRSTELTAEEAQKMCELKPDLELQTIERAGHFVHAEKPQEFADALKGFLLKHES